MNRQKQRITLTAAVAALVPLVAACGAEQAGGGSGGGSGTIGAAGPAVTGVHWSVDSVTVDGRTHQAPERAHMTIGDDGRAEGSFGCNTFSARAAVEGDRIRLSDAASTEMACEDMSMAVEEALARALTTGPLSAGTDGDRLTLTTADGDTVRLSEQRDTALHGTRWTITTPAVSGDAAHLTFDEQQGTVSGSLGCNRVNAEATVGDGSITLGAASTTRMVCEDSLMAAEKQLLGLFDNKIDYRVEPDTLTLTSPNGSTVRAVADQ
ncbi:META domain-containing protein [Streptomyces poriticola]|uniref:META domain-containing protein n=1 Tax=Streptomyces poriticola TaxID=3120506 RepID=UPI002FCE1774